MIKHRTFTQVKKRLRVSIRPSILEMAKKKYLEMLKDYEGDLMAGTKSWVSGEGAEYLLANGYAKECDTEEKQEKSVVKIDVPVSKQPEPEIPKIEPVNIRPIETINHNTLPLRWSFFNALSMVEIDKSSVGDTYFKFAVKYDGQYVESPTNIPKDKCLLDHWKSRMKKVMQSKKLGDFALADHMVEGVFLVLEDALKELDRLSKEDKPLIEVPAMSEDEKAEALALLKKDNILYLIKEQLDKEIVGEDETKLLLYLICASVKLKNKLSALLSGESSSGKTFIAKKVLELFPPENVLDLTRISPTALDYFVEQNWDDMILFVGEGTGAKDAIETIKMYTDDISGGSKVLVTEKDENDKNRATIKQSKGLPVFVTTSAKIIEDPEFMNRLLVLGTDMSKEQTERVVKKKTKMMVDIDEEDGNHAKQVMRNAFKLLDKYEVRIPYAEEVEKLFTNTNIRTRRDHEKLLKIISASAILHQYQRAIVQTKKGNSYVIAHPVDLFHAMTISRPTLFMTTQSLEKSTLDLYNKLLEVHDKIAKSEDFEKVKDAPCGQYFLIGDLSRNIRARRQSVYGSLNLLIDLGILDKAKVGREAHYYLIESPENVVPNSTQALNGQPVMRFRSSSVHVSDKNLADSYRSYLSNHVSAQKTTYKGIEYPVLGGKHPISGEICQRVSYPICISGNYVDTSFLEPTEVCKPDGNYLGTERQVQLNNETKIKSVVPNSKIVVPNSNELVIEEIDIADSNTFQKEVDEAIENLEPPKKPFIHYQ